VTWVTAEKPNLPLYAAADSRIERGYQEDQVIDTARSGPMNVNAVTDIRSRSAANWRTCSTGPNESSRWSFQDRTCVTYTCRE
jgi:hypothetical protein